MNPKILATLLVTILVLLSSCGESATVATKTSSQIISLRQNLTSLEEAAYAWESDASLINANLPLYREVSARPWSIRATFHSESKVTEGLAVTLGRDETSITTEVVQISAQEHDSLSIREENWGLDSQQALDVLLQHAEDTGVLVDEFDCNTLRLEGNRARQGDPAIWRLTLDHCIPTSESIVMRVNAITGEIIASP